MCSSIIHEQRACFAGSRRRELAKLPAEPYSIESCGESWDDYFRSRGIPQKPINAARHMLMDALSVPMTVLMAIRRVGLRFEPGDVVRIDLPGARKLECSDMDLMYREMGKALDGCAIHLRLVGPQLLELPAMQIANVSITFHVMLYQELLAIGGEPPDLAVLCNAGICTSSAGSWLPAIAELARLEVPTVVTGYDLKHTACSLHCLVQRSDKELRVIIDGINPFCGGEMHSSNSTSIVVTTLDEHQVLEEVKKITHMNDMLENGDRRLADEYLSQMSSRKVRNNSHWFVVQGYVDNLGGPSLDSQRDLGVSPSFLDSME